jgi:hypothetical protein
VFVLVNVKWIDFNKRGCFLSFRFDVPSLSTPFSSIFPVTRRITRKAGHSTIYEEARRFKRAVLRKEWILRCIEFLENTRFNTFFMGIIFRPL